MSTLPVAITLLLATAAMAAPAPQPCVAVDNERITAGDLARAVASFSSIPADTDLGFAPVPGVRRYFHFPELRRMALRYNVALPTDSEACIERAMEILRPERVVEAMRKALADPEARIEILELCRFPVPRGELEFQRATLPVDTDAPVVWRGMVRYADGRKYGVWASVKVRVRAIRVVATENLAAGKPIQPGQVKLETAEVYPAASVPAPSLETVLGSSVRVPVPAGGIIPAGMLDAPKEVERGDLVQVEVRSGAALLKLEARAESAGRHGEPIKVHTLVNGKSFSARVAGKDRVVVAAGAESQSQDRKP